MSVPLVVRPQADAELLAARDWYETQRAGLGRQFVDEVGKMMRAVATRPLSFPKVHGDMRQAILRRFRTVCFSERLRRTKSFSGSFTGGDIPVCGGPDSEA